MSKGNTKGQRRLSVIVMFIVIIVALFLLLIDFITDWLWFKEMGYVSVFFHSAVHRAESGDTRFRYPDTSGQPVPETAEKGYFKKIASHEATDMKKLNRYTGIISVVFGLVTAFYAVTNLWFEILQFINATDFDIKDPLFHLDISFYIFRLDFLKQLNEMFIGIVLLLIIVTVIYYTILLTMHSPDIF